jgi:hypothetical protein
LPPTSRKHLAIDDECSRDTNFLFHAPMIQNKACHDTDQNRFLCFALSWYKSLLFKRHTYDIMDKQMLKSASLMLSFGNNIVSEKKNVRVFILFLFCSTLMLLIRIFGLTYIQHYAFLFNQWRISHYWRQVYPMVIVNGPHIYI